MPRELQVLFSDAIDAGIVTVNPFASKGRLIKLVSPEEPETEEVKEQSIPYTRDEQRRILEAIGRDLSDRGAVLVALRAGLRRSEVLTLRRTDVDLDERRLRVVRRLSRGQIEAPKTAKSVREVPMSRELVAALRRLIASQNEEALRRGTELSDLLFPARRRRDGAYTQEESRFGKRFVRYLEQAGVERKTTAPFHRLRHTFASELLANGVPIIDVSQWLGHSSMELTARVYAHAIPKPDDHEVVDQLDFSVAHSAPIPPPL